MKNNLLILFLAMTIGLSMSAYLPSTQIGYIIFNILRGIR